MTTTEAARQILRAARKAAGYSRQADFAAHLGRHRDWVARRERGETPITLDDLDEWAAGCGLDPRTIITEIRGEMHR